MPEDREITLNEALLMYTEAKLEIAAKFREGISYNDFSEFEKRIDFIDGILQREAQRLQKKLEEDTELNAS
ncbi:MAG: hypothetical protein JW982_11740 [Spirochaetes bacterium]|nr:hypothetical protein [Spirochaetota bacterium]